MPQQTLVSSYISEALIVIVGACPTVKVLTGRVVFRFEVVQVEEDGGLCLGPFALGWRTDECITKITYSIDNQRLPELRRECLRSVLQEASLSEL